MLPTFEVVSDQVLISRFYRRGKGIVVGDIITFDSVVEPGERVIKRVLGLEGDYVLRDTPGESTTMIQVSKVVERLNCDIDGMGRFLRVTFGWWETICHIRETPGILVPCRRL